MNRAYISLLKNDKNYFVSEKDKQNVAIRIGKNFEAVDFEAVDLDTIKKGNYYKIRQKASTKKSFIAKFVRFEQKLSFKTLVFEKEDGSFISINLSNYTVLEEKFSTQIKNELNKEFSVIVVQDKRFFSLNIKNDGTISLDRDDFL